MNQQEPRPTVIMHPDAKGDADHFRIVQGNTSTLHAMTRPVRGADRLSLPALMTRINREIRPLGWQTVGKGFWAWVGQPPSVYMCAYLRRR